MTQNESTQEPVGPVEVVARRMRELREKRRLSGARLAERMREAGIPWQRDTVANLENGRRASVGVDELLALAAVLEVAPTHLLVPLEDEQPYEITPGRVEPSGTVRDWVRGYITLNGTDPRNYFSETPANEFDISGAFRAEQLQSAAEWLAIEQHRLEKAARQQLENLRRKRDQKGSGDE
jgi:transcriptional regulator with XRE-family HTH domain